MQDHCHICPALLRLSRACKQARLCRVTYAAGGQCRTVLCAQGRRCSWQAWLLTWCLQTGCPSWRRRSASWASAHLSLQPLQMPSASIRYRQWGHRPRSPCKASSYSTAVCVLAKKRPASDKQRPVILPSPDRAVVCIIPFSLLQLGHNALQAGSALLRPLHAGEVPTGKLRAQSKPAGH